MRLKLLPAISVWLLSFSFAAASEDYALIIGDSGQVEGMREETSISAVDFAAPLRAAGFEIVQTKNRSSGNMRIAAQRIATIQDTKGIKTLVIVVMGPVASTERGAWAMANGGPGASSLNVGVSGLPVGALSDIAAETPGTAVILIAPGRPMTSFGRGLSPGADALMPADGVGYAIGSAADLSAFLSEGLLLPHQNLDRLREVWADRLTFQGHWPADRTLQGAQ